MVPRSLNEDHGIRNAYLGCSLHDVTFWQVFQTRRVAKTNTRVGTTKSHKKLRTAVIKCKDVERDKLMVSFHVSKSRVSSLWVIVINVIVVQRAERV